MRSSDVELSQIEKLNGKDLELHQAREASSQLERQLVELREEHAVVTNAKMALQKQLQQVLARRSDLDMLKSSVHALRQKLQARNFESTAQLHAADSPSMDAHVASHGKASPGISMATNGTASTAFMKASPPPSVVSKMTEPPPTTEYHYQQELGHAAALATTRPDADVSPQAHTVTTPSPPKWYTKLRVQA